MVQMQDKTIRCLLEVNEKNRLNNHTNNAFEQDGITPLYSYSRPTEDQYLDLPNDAQVI